jgi:hypothetical protein
MNERIRELAKQAELPLLDVDGKCKYGDTYFSTEKFAELIVRECMELTKQCSTGKGIHDLFADEIIEEHFGVQE